MEVLRNGMERIKKAREACAREGTQCSPKSERDQIDIPEPKYKNILIREYAQATYACRHYVHGLATHMHTFFVPIMFI